MDSISIRDICTTIQMPAQRLSRVSDAAISATPSICSLTELKEGLASAEIPAAVSIAGKSLSLASNPLGLSESGDNGEGELAKSPSFPVPPLALVLASPAVCMPPGLASCSPTSMGPA